MDTDFVFKRFTEHLLLVKKYSPRTIVSYQNDLDQFSAFLKKEFDSQHFSDIGHQQVRSWIASMLLNKLNPRSVNRKLSTLKSLYRYAQKEGLTDKNPIRKIQAPKVPKRLPVYIEKSRMDLLPDKFATADGFELLRDYLVLELLYGTGIRLSECIGLKHSNFSSHSSTLKVLGKRNKERLVPVNEALARLLNRYSRLKNELFPGIEQIIVTDKGLPAYPQLIYRIVKKHLADVSTVSKKSPHVLRHSYATHLLDAGAELNAIKELLGHSSLAATQVYTHNSIERLKEVHHAAHPKS